MQAMGWRDRRVCRRLLAKPAGRGDFAHYPSEQRGQPGRTHQHESRRRSQNFLEPNDNNLIIFKKQMRFEDLWWLQVCDECRRGCLSHDSWAFLHGHDTSVSGSWLDGQPQCAAGCMQQTGECAECAAERQRRRRVLTGPDDPRLQAAKFKHAYAIVPNNDLQTEICKYGTAKWAREHGQPVLWCAAVDTISGHSRYLSDDAERKRANKVKWLSLHHQKCGGLFGVVPLVRGMPVHLTQHVDRSDKALLKQRVGTLVGWDLHDEEETPPTAQDHHLSYMPKGVYVQFYDEDVQGNKTPCKWTVGSLAPGVYPIDPDRQDWYVDGDKQNRVARRQFPLSPHFANTVYSSQGLTIGTGVVDLKVGRYTDATTLYVAISRFRRADHLLILQPFDGDVLQQVSPRKLRSCCSTWSSGAHRNAKSR